MAKKTQFNLEGEWLYKTDDDGVGERLRFFDPSFDASSWKTMNIPSNWEVAGLHDHSGVVWFRRKVSGVRDQGLGKEYILRFKGVDYFADVWLNGVKLGNHEGYFQPFEFNVTDIVSEGDNVLVVKVNSPKEGGNWPLRKRLIKGVFGHHDIRPGAWDKELGQSMGTGGIWNSVELVINEKLKIKNVKLRNELLDDFKRAELRVDVDIENFVATPLRGEVRIGIKENGKRESPVATPLRGEVFKKIKATLKPGMNTIKTKLEIKNPKLWWCWDQGTPNLYEVEVEVQVKGVKAVKDVKAVRFGIREIRKGNDGSWWLNGRRIFIRGSNIIPEEYLSTYNSERIAKDIGLIKEANVNAVRVHAHVNREEFYDACDEAGILVWQDFPLQWEYERSKEFTENARRQIRDMVNLLYNHPSIVAWCCHNEPTKSRETLDPILFQEAKKLDKTRIVFQSSNFAEHPYPGWFSGKLEYFSALPGKPFVTEFGAQALPGVGALKKMFKEGDLWPPNWKEWAYRDFTYEQYFNIAGLGTGNSIEEFVEISQNYQARLLKFAIETYRRNKFSEIFGVFHFMLLEPWPCISYSVLEYSRTRKRGYQALKAAFQSVILIYVPERWVLTIGDQIRGTFFLVNDLPDSIPHARIKMKLEGGDNVEFRDIFIDIESNSCKEITNNVYSLADSLPIPEGIAEGDYRFVIEILDGKGKPLCRNDYEVKLKTLPKGLSCFGAAFEW